MCQCEHHKGLPQLSRANEDVFSLKAQQMAALYQDGNLFVTRLCSKSM